MAAKPTLLVAGSMPERPDVVPIDYVLDWFRARASLTGITNRVLVLRSETASGKSTVVPPALYSSGIGDSRRGIIVTQPRVLTARENVTQIRMYYRDLTGADIGYSTKYDKLKPLRRGILSATIGTLTQVLMHQSDDAIAARWRMIMIDEVHERSIELDLTIALLRGLLTRMQTSIDCPFVILASATIEPDEYVRYFGVSMDNYIYVRGASHPREERWEFMGDHTANNVYKSCVDAIRMIVRADKSSEPSAREDILVFMPGAAEIKSLVGALTALNTQIDGPARIIAVESGMVREQSPDYRVMMKPFMGAGTDPITVRVGNKLVPARRRVFISTAVAETGMTFDDLRYIIDCGMSREPEYSPHVNASGIITKPAPRSRVTQRIGRVGRKFPGVFIPLYPRHIYDKLPQQQYPAVVVSDILADLLKIVLAQNNTGTLDALYADPANANTLALTWPRFRAHEIDLMTPPPTDTLCNALRILHNIGILADMRLTAIGRLCAALTVVGPQHARAIVGAYWWGAPVRSCIHAVAWSVASADVRADAVDWLRIYMRAGVARTSAGCARARLRIACEFIDGAVLWRALEQTMRAGEPLPQWCESVGIKMEPIGTFIELVNDIITHMVYAHMRVADSYAAGTGAHSASIAGENVRVAGDIDFANPRDINALKHALYDGFRDNLLVLDPVARVYTSRWHGVPVRVPALFEDTKLTREAGVNAGVRVAALPRYIICAQVRIKSRLSKRLTYVLKTACVSAIDGYFSPDLTYGY